MFQVAGRRTNQPWSQEASAPLGTVREAAAYRAESPGHTRMELGQAERALESAVLIARAGGADDAASSETAALAIADLTFRAVRNAIAIDALLTGVGVARWVALRRRHNAAAIAIADLAFHAVRDAIATHALLAGVGVTLSIAFIVATAGN